MTDSKLDKANISKGNYNLAIVSHSPSQQTATIVVLEKPSVFRIFKNFGISNTNANKKDEKTFHDKNIFLIVFSLLVILFLCSGTGFYVMWFTEKYNDHVLSSLTLSNNSEALEMWLKPPINPELRIHIFNYTNTKRYLEGYDDKLIVEDLGPYTYKEVFLKANVTFNNNHTISYRDNRTYTFVQEKSKGHQYDQIVVPNIVFLTASSKYRYATTISQFGVNMMMSTSGSKVFSSLTAHEFIWGYNEPLLQKTGAKDPIFGMLKTRNGTSKDVITVFTGEDDIRKLSLMDSFNGEKQMKYWSTDECNQLDGSDGSQFPPHWMDKKTPLQVFIKAFCRKFPLVYEKEVNIAKGLPAWRYKAPQNVFAHPDNNTANSCYCNIKTNECPPSGVFNATLCFDAPIFISFPHFYTGDPTLFEHIDGLQPDERKHLTYADVHSRMAFPLDGASRFQINVQVQKANMITGMAKLREGLYLPVLWMEVTSGEISDEVRETLYNLTFSINALQLSLQYGFLLVSATTIALIVAACYYNGKNRQLLQKTLTTT